jgi:hypothetical protein
LCKELTRFYTPKRWLAKPQWEQLPLFEFPAR